MRETSVFDRLVSSLDSMEREELLKNIQRSVSLSYEPLKKESESIESYDPEIELRKLNLWQRIILFFKAVFTQKDRITLIEEGFFKQLEAQIDNQCPGLIDFRQSLFLAKMHQELSKLKSCVVFFQMPLDQALGREKKDFYAFLAKRDLETIHERLIEETDPFNLWESIKPLEENDVRLEMLDRFDEILDSIPEEDKNQVYTNAQALFSLYTLSSHSFDPMLYCFGSEHSSAARGCGFLKLKKHIMSLAERLQAAQFPPSGDALYALFLFLYREQLEDEEFNLEDKLKNDLLLSGKALAGIREFNERIPLIPIIKYITYDLDYHPKKIGGGEDWFVIYKDFWKQRLDKAYMSFLHYRTRENLIEHMVEFLGRKNLPELSTYKSEAFREDITVKHSLSLSFLKGFFESAFKTMYRPLKLIHIKAEFYKEGNRQTFTDSFNFLSKIDEKISQLEGRLDSKGDLGMKIQDVRKELINSQLKKKKIQSILASAEKNARLIIDESIEEMNNLSRLLKGILHGQPGDPFDTLLNIDSIGGRENKELIASWEKALGKLEEAVNLLSDIRELEIKNE